MLLTPLVIPSLCLLLCLALAPAHAARFNVACESLTGVDGCIECSGSDQRRCFLCHKSLVPAWSADGKIAQCKATTSGAACTKASGDPNCARCDGATCVQCKTTAYFAANNKCVEGSCAQYSKNPNCAACNPDGTCTRCKDANPPLFLMPVNSIYLNVPHPETQCVSLARLNQEAASIIWSSTDLTAGCIEVDTDFRCNRCKEGHSLTGGKCVAFASGSKCKASLAYRQYCAQCNAAGDRCIECNGSRSLINGACGLPCKQLYGIGCRKCNASVCMEGDPAYANGRR